MNLRLRALFVSDSSPLATSFTEMDKKRIFLFVFTSVAITSLHLTHVLLMVSCTIAVILGHIMPPQTLLIKTCEGVPFPAFWRANHGVVIATIQPTFFNVNAKENEKKRRKKDQQLSSGIKVYTEKSLDVGFEFMLIMIALLFHAKLCFNVSWKTKSTRNVLFDSTRFV